MTDTNAVETTPEVVPTKFSVLKSKITREGLVLGGVISGFIIAGGIALLKAQAPSNDSELTTEELQEMAAQEAIVNDNVEITP